MTSTGDQLPASTGSVNGESSPSTTITQKSLGIAYLLGVPLGFTGAHHFYLGNYSLGFTYLITVGLAGLGWVVDWCRMKSLVDDANRINEVKWRYENEQGGFRDENVLNYITDNRKLMDCYLILPISGLLGKHHLYLKRYGWWIAYLLTFGLGGVGYLMDWFRLPRLYRQYKDKLKAKSEGVEQIDFCHLDDAYACCVILGFFGFHRFYLGQYTWGIVYLLTFGLFGWGWLFDMIRMKRLVERVNQQILQDEEQRRLVASQQVPAVCTGGGTHVGVPPTYIDQRGAPVQPPAGYYFPPQPHLSVQTPGYPHSKQQLQSSPGHPAEINRQGVPPPPYI